MTRFGIMFDHMRCQGKKKILICQGKKIIFEININV